MLTKTSFDGYRKAGDVVASPEDGYELLGIVLEKPGKIQHVFWIDAEEEDYGPQMQGGDWIASHCRLITNPAIIARVRTEYALWKLEGGGNG